MQMNYNSSSKKGIKIRDGLEKYSEVIYILLLTDMDYWVRLGAGKPPSLVA